jgi:hypothetical protein
VAAPAYNSGMAVLPHRPLARRLIGHALAWVIAALVAWLILRAYRQPELLLDLANFRLC